MIKSIRKTFAIDLDGTLCEMGVADYQHRIPIKNRIENVNKLYDAGHTIIIHTARHWKRLRETKKWLDDNGVKYHTIAMSKPLADLYVDDKSALDTYFDQ
jgi:hydroxymethylpyrimidine pyrophosphatase-like HAD family hydrolase